MLFVKHFYLTDTLGGEIAYNLVEHLNSASNAHPTTQHSALNFLTLLDLKAQGFFAQRLNLPKQDCSNQGRGRISRSVRVFDPSSHMTCGTQG